MMAADPRPRPVETCLLLLLCFCSRPTSGSNILFFLPFGSISHVHSTAPLMENLGSRGHNVTYLTIILPKNPFRNNVNVLHMKKLEDLYESLRPNSFDMMQSSFLEELDFTSMVVSNLCPSMLATEEFQRVVVDRTTRYDLIVMDNLLSECGLSIVPLLDSPPLVYFCTTVMYDWTATALDIPVPFSYVPTVFLPQDSRMGFAQRLTNAVVSLAFQAFRMLHVFPTANRIVQKQWPGQPMLEDVEQNVSLVLTNSHSQSLDIVRPTASFVVEVGGMHCRPARKLGKDFEDFFAQSGSEGFIYFSMGTNIKCDEMTPDKVRIFLDAFRRLNQTVLWKFESKLTDLPANVRITEWAPQQDILGHPNIKLFISHGGQLSTQEAIYHGVPMLGLPMGWDQVTNLDSGISKGFARKLHYGNLSSDDIYYQISQIIGNKRYKEQAEHYSSLLRDRPQDPLKTATYWVEYMIRHRNKSRTFLRFNAVKELNFFQYFLLDVIAFVLTVLAAIVFILFYLGKCIFGKLRKGQDSSEKKKTD